MKQKHLQSILNEVSALATDLSRNEVAHLQLVKMLSDRLSRIEEAQTEQLKHLNNVVEYLSYFKEVYKKYDADELDRGQTSSALYGLIKRLDKLEKRLLKEPA